MSLDIVSIVRAVVGEMSALPSFVYGTKTELNLAVDQQTVKPVAFLFGAATITASYDSSGGTLDAYSFLMQFMEQTTFGAFIADTNAALLRQQDSAHEFMIRLRDYKTPDGRKVFRITPGKDAYKIIPGFNSYDANYSGVTLQVINLRPMYPNAFC